MSKRSEEPHADFNWPPPDEELAQWFDSASSHEEFAQGAVRSARNETSATDSITSDLAVAKHEPARDETSGAGWAAEIAQLQELLEALTEKVEWRVANTKRR